MKTFKSIFLIAFILLSASFAVSTSNTVEALSTAKQQTCHDKWNGRTSGIAAFKDTNCYSGNGGNCQIGSRKEIDDTGKQVIIRQINCSDPAGDAAANQRAATSISGTDPAVDTNINCESADSTNCEFLSKYINPTIKLLAGLVGLVAVIAIIVGGIQITTSAGDPQKSAAGKAHIRNAVIGLVAFLFLYAALQWLVPGGIL